MVSNSASYLPLIWIVIFFSSTTSLGLRLLFLFCIFQIYNRNICWIVFLSLFDFIYTYCIILYLNPVDNLYLTLAFLFSPKIFILTLCSPGNCFYSTDSSAFPINHLYFKTCNFHLWFLTPTSFLFFTLEKCFFHRCFFQQDAFKKP